MHPQLTQLVCRIHFPAVPRGLARTCQVENPFLEPYYKEPKKYALPMQIWLLKQRFVTYVRALKYSLDAAAHLKGVILDRSVRPSQMAHADVRARH